MDKFEKRRIALSALRKSLGHGGIRKIADKINKDPSYVSRMLYPEDKEGRKRIGEDSVEELDKAFPGWLDETIDITSLDITASSDNRYIKLPYLEVESSAGAGKEPIDNPPIMQHIQVLEEWALEHFGKSATDKIRIITNKGDSMLPTIRNGDILFVDITQNHYEADGVYIIDWNGRLLTKRLRAMSDGRLAILSDNKELYEPEYVTAKEADQLTICGYVRKCWSLKDF